MDIQSAQFNEQGDIVMTIDGAALIVPDDMNNRHRKMIEDASITIRPWPGLTIEELRENAKNDVLEFVKQIGELLTDGYPMVERESWVKKLDEAKAIVAGETDPANYPIIAAEIAITGKTASEVAPVIIAKAIRFEQASGMISGMRQKTIAAIDAAADKDGIDVVLDAAKVQAETALASLVS